MTSQLLTHPCASCLTAGKSPAQWRRDLSRKTTHFNTIRRTCSWIHLPTGPVKLKLEPLLGSCLAELTGSDVREASQAVHRVGRSKPDWRSPLPPSASKQPPIPKARSVQKQNSCPPSQPRSRQQPASNSATGTDSCSAQVPLKLEPKASPDFLCRLVNESAPTRIYRDSPAEPKPQPSGQPIQPPAANSAPCPPAERPFVKPAKAEVCPPSEQPTSPRPNTRSFYQPPRSPRLPSPLPVCPDATHHRRWLDRLAQDTDRRLRRESIDAPYSPVGSTAVQPGVTQTAQKQSTQWMHQGTQSSVPAVQSMPLEQGFVQQEASIVQGGDRPPKENPFTEQWSLPIAGQTAPIDLLVYLAERTTSTTSPQEAEVLTSNRASNPSVPGGDRSSEGQRDRTLPSHSQHRQSDVERTWAGDGQGRSPNHPALAASPMPAAAGYEGGSMTPSSVNASNQQPLPFISPVQSSNSTPQVTPPAVTPSLPALTAPQAGDLPTPSVAAALTQHQAQQEAIAPPDLGLLADQIKRILNEEARRHGINL